MLEIGIVLILFILVVLGMFVCIIAIVTGFLSFFTGGALFTRTHNVKIDTVLDAVELQPGAIVYDLGCGDGRFLFQATTRYAISGIGFEVNPWPYCLGFVKNIFRRGKVKFLFRNFMNEPIHDADFIFCYLFPDVLESVEQKLSRELKAGTHIVSCNFPIPGWNPHKVLRANHPTHNEPLYFYRFPAKNMLES